MAHPGHAVSLGSGRPVNHTTCLSLYQNPMDFLETGAKKLLSKSENDLTVSVLSILHVFFNFPSIKYYPATSGTNYNMLLMVHILSFIQSAKVFNNFL